MKRTKKTPAAPSSIGRALAQAVEPFARELAQELAAVVQAHIDEKLAAAKSFALDRLRAELEGSHVQDDERSEDGDAAGEALPRRPRRRTRRLRDRQLGARADRRDRDGDREDEGAGAAASEEASVAEVARTRAPKTCSKCGAIGYTAAGCGRTHNVAAAAAPPSSPPASIASPPPTQPIGAIGSRESRPRPVRVAESSDADDEEGPVELLVTAPKRRVIVGDNRHRRRNPEVPRSRTIPAKRITRAMLAEGARLNPPVEVERPRTRGDCRDAMRPCPFVGCTHHLYLDINPDTGSIKINFPEVEPWELAESCSLDVADRGGLVLEEVGGLMNLTRERVRQVEVRGLLKLRATPISSDLNPNN